jgi:hypothetical protein
LKDSEEGRTLMSHEKSFRIKTKNKIDTAILEHKAKAAEENLKSKRITCQLSEAKNLITTMTTMSKMGRMTLRPPSPRQNRKGSATPKIKHKTNKLRSSHLIDT